MVDRGNRSTLRTLVGRVVAQLSGLTHAMLNPAFVRLGMPQVPEDAGTKAERAT